MIQNYPIYKFFNIIGTTSGVPTLIVAGSGVLHNIVFNKMVASDVVTIYDGTGTNGGVIATITLPGTLLDQPPKDANFDCRYKTGLFITVGTGVSNVTVNYI